MNNYRQTILSDGDMTIIVQNTFHSPEGKTGAPFNREVWHLIVTSPHFDNGIYRNEKVESYDAGLEAAWDQFHEEFGGQYSREELQDRIKRIDF